MDESMLMAKEATATRYFFFSGDKLYKMFMAFDKEILEGKSFSDFGQLMQAQYGRAKEVNVEERTKAGVKIHLDHYVWGSKSGDMLRLVDRSEFYDVYCLVIYDGAIARRQDEARRARKTGPKGDSLVEAVTSAPVNDRDANDNIVDQITGKQIKKTGRAAGRGHRGAVGDAGCGEGADAGRGQSAGAGRVFGQPQAVDDQAQAREGKAGQQAQGRPGRSRPLIRGRPGWSLPLIGFPRAWHLRPSPERP